MHGLYIVSNGQIGIKQFISTPVPPINSITTEILLPVHNNYFLTLNLPTRITATKTHDNTREW